MVSLQYILIASPRCSFCHDHTHNSMIMTVTVPTKDPNKIHCRACSICMNCSESFAFVADASSRYHGLAGADIAAFSCTQTALWYSMQMSLLLLNIDCSCQDCTAML